MKEKIHIPEIILQTIFKQAENEYPSECCGVILISLTKSEASLRIYPCRNAQNECRLQDAKNFPRDSKTGYFISPKDLLAIQKEIRRTGEKIKIIYHSHPEAEAFFSEEDQRLAILDSEPAYPDVDYLVISVKKGKVAGHRLFSWDAHKKSFV